MTPKPLTPADVLDLRASVRWRVANGSVPLEPHIIYLPAEGVLLVRCDGRPMCSTTDPAIACSLLIQERAEPGFIRRVCDAAEPPDLASLDPAGYAAKRRLLNAEEAKIKAHEAATLAAHQEAARRLRNVPKVDVGSLNLDDLL